jgi:hypothetical protein
MIQTRSYWYCLSSHCEDDSKRGLTIPKRKVKPTVSSRKEQSGGRVGAVEPVTDRQLRAVGGRNTEEAKAM